MKITIVTSINDENSCELAAGAIVSLVAEPENPKDPNAVKAMLGEEFAGYVANSATTVSEGCITATSVVKHLKNPDVAGINARLLSPFLRETKSPDIQQVCWVAELFFLPVWKDKDEKAAPITLDVGGNPTFHRNLGATIAKLDSFKNGGLVLKLSQSTIDGAVAAFVFSTEELSKSSPAPAGEIKNPPDALVNVLQTGVLPITPVKATGKREYQVQVELNASGLNKFHADMDDVVKRCVMQVRDIKERVSYLISQGVPDSIIRGVLKNLQPLEAGVWVERPLRLYSQLSGDTTLTRALGYYLAGKNIRLVGEKGTGKNTLIASVCWAFYQPYCRVQGNADVDKLDLLGSTTLDEKGTSFELSPFIKAIRSGHDAILDEVNAVKPEVALVLHSLTDDAKSVEVPGYGLVKAHPRAHIWATMNEEYVGTSDLNDATADRFVPLFLDQQANIKGLLQNLFPDADENQLTICEKLYGKILDAVRSGTCTPSAITTRGYIDALEAAKWLPFKVALLDNIAGRPSDKEEREAIRNFINAVCPV